MTPSQPTPHRPYGFRADVQRRLQRETDDLFRRRLAIACWVGAALFPPYALQDLKLLDEHGVEMAPAVVVAIRLTAAAFLAVTALVVRRVRLTGWALTVADVGVFGGISWLVAYFTALFWGHVPDFYVGIIQVIMVRAIFLPGGWRRALPTVVISALSFPLGLILFGDGTPGEVIGRDPTLFSTANVALLTFVGFGVLGSVMYDRLRVSQLRSELEGKYRIEGVIGQGGWGVVYRAWHNKLDMSCAIKVIPAGEGAAAEEARQRFEREAQLTSQLRSAHVVRIFDYGETEEGDPYYAMELLEGLSWQELVEGDGRQPAARVLHLATQVCDGLTEAHQQGLIHRDVKPANLFVLPTPEHPDFAKVLDFGIAKALTESAEAQLTQDGTVVGTPTYMAPEQIEGRPADARSDIYALGGALFFMLTGGPPFGDDAPMAVMHRKLTQDLKSPGELHPELRVPADLDEVVRRCLSRDAADRFTSVPAVKAALEACDGAGAWADGDAAGWWTAWEARGEGMGAGEASGRPLPDSGAETVPLGGPTSD
jgi:eukaryotic-like serine/threonine-protein kinase